MSFDVLAKMKFKKLDEKNGATQLFKTTLEKGLFSSPAACLVTIKNRISRLQNTVIPGVRAARTFPGDRIREDIL